MVRGNFQTKFPGIEIADVSIKISFNEWVSGHRALIMKRYVTQANEAGIKW